MGLFDIFKSEKSWEEENVYTGETPDCPRCGQSLTKVCFQRNVLRKLQVRFGR